LSSRLCVFALKVIRVFGVFRGSTSDLSVLPLSLFILHPFFLSAEAFGVGGCG
jgi:hypothetical protein